MTTTITTMTKNNSNYATDNIKQISQYQQITKNNNNNKNKTTITKNYNNNNNNNNNKQ